MTHASVPATSLPVVDLRAYRSGTAADKREVLATLLRLLEEWGFLVLDGHGLEPERVAETFAQTAALFALPSEAKRACEVPESLGNRGYVGFGGEKAFGAKVSDLREFWHVGQERVPAMLVPAYLPNVWPSEGALPNFRAHMLAVYTEFEALAATVLHATEEALDLPRVHFASMIIEGNGVLRLTTTRPSPQMLRRAPFVRRRTRTSTSSRSSSRGPRAGSSSSAPTAPGCPSRRSRGRSS